MKKVKEPAPHVKAAQIEKEAVRALSVDEVEEALTKSTYGGEEKPADDIIVVPDGTPYDIIKKLAEYRRYIKELEGDKEILKTECLALKDENKKYQREIDDYKKTISKMKYAHEAEVQDLKDQLGEAKAVESAADKERALAIAEKNNYADALDNDSVAFEEILGLAILMERSAKSMQEMSKMLQDKTEGKV